MHSTYKVLLPIVALLFGPVYASHAQVTLGQPGLGQPAWGQPVHIERVPGTTLAPATMQAQPTEDIAIIRQRFVDDLLAPPVNISNITKLMKTLQADGSWPDINYKDVSRTGFEHSRHLQNMLDMARALKKKSADLYKNAALKKALSTSLDFWLQHDFICDNWWWNEMGTPNWMINILLVTDTDLTAQQRTAGLRIANRANLQAFGARPGGDLIQIAGMLGKQALFTGNKDTLVRVIQVMASEIKTSTGRGMQPDLSFHHRTDNVISTLAYGTGYASAFSYWAAKIVGTQYTLPDSSMKLLIDYYLDGICQSLVYGIYHDPGAMNRDVTRKGALDAEGIAIPQNLLAASNYRAKELQNIINLRNGITQPNMVRDRYFWHSHYYTHQRTSYFASLRMHSVRANNMEEPHNEEGIKNHHYGDGSTFITRTGKEYFDIFPVWDWQKIPGTTIVQRPEFPQWKELAKKGLTDFAGGVSDGVYGAAAFDFASVHDPLKAHKAWFFFDKEIVCLGAGIQSESPYPVVTTLNQSVLNKPVVVTAHKAVAPTKHSQKTDKHALTGDSHVLASGNASLTGVTAVFHDSIAYLFPQPVAIHIRNETATGTWRSINHQAWATNDTVRKPTFTLWIDHGIQPKAAGYAYLVVPGMDVKGVAQYNKQSPIRILSNTPDLQAVEHTGLHIIQVVFYKAGSIAIDDRLQLATDKPCIVMVSFKGNRIEKISVADPTEKLQALQLKINGKALQVELPQESGAGSTVVLATLNDHI